MATLTFTTNAIKFASDSMNFYYEDTAYDIYGLIYSDSTALDAYLADETATDAQKTEAEYTDGYALGLQIEVDSAITAFGTVGNDVLIFGGCFSGVYTDSSTDAQTQTTGTTCVGQSYDWDDTSGSETLALSTVMYYAPDQTVAIDATATWTVPVVGETAGFDGSWVCSNDQADGVVTITDVNTIICSRFLPTPATSAAADLRMEDSDDFEGVMAFFTGVGGADPDVTYMTDDTVTNYVSYIWSGAFDSLAVAGAVVAVALTF